MLILIKDIQSLVKHWLFLVIEHEKYVCNIIDKKMRC